MSTGAGKTGRRAELSAYAPPDHQSQSPREYLVDPIFDPLRKNPRFGIIIASNLQPCPSDATLTPRGRPLP